MLTGPSVPTSAPLVSPSAHPAAIDWMQFVPNPSAFTGVDTFDASDSDQVRRYLDLNAVVKKWEFPVGFPEVLDDAEWGPIARQLLADADGLLSNWLSAGMLRAEVRFGVWQAAARGSEIVISPPSAPSVSLLCPRVPVGPGESYCLADFIKPAAEMGAGSSDYIGGFAIRLHGPFETLIESYQTNQDDYRTLLTKDLWLLYRSAVADYLHYRLRRFIWAYCDDDDLSNDEIMAGLHQGIRVDSDSVASPGQAGETALLTLLGAAGWQEEDVISNEYGFSPVLSGYFLAHPRSRTIQAFANELTSIV
jgi:5-methyltetrahydrofolate--homocysteine methyltransferase